MNNCIHEECGVFGIWSPKKSLDPARSSYFALYALQHRGQESCGIAVNDRGVISHHRGIGLVSEVFSEQKIQALGEGHMAIGHVRYSTSGVLNLSNAQPLCIQHIKGPLAIAHNGNITNSSELRKKFELEGAIFYGTSDTEVIAYAITSNRLKTSCIEDAVKETMKILKGSFSMVVMSAQKLIAARDPIGFRPLCLGKKADGSVLFASENCAFSTIGGEFVRDVKPGEIIIVDQGNLRSDVSLCGKKRGEICVFEFVYFARPDSTIDGASVYEARFKAGKFLALEHPAQADVVIGVPDSGIIAARGFANQSNIPYCDGFVKNKYIGRSFIQPTQNMRENVVKIKLNAIKSTVNGKRVVMVDDSIVRGTTSKRIVKILREAGAKEVHMRVSSPPFKNPCYFGTDIDSRDNLIACKMSIDEIAAHIGVDSLGYLSVESVKKIADSSQTDFCAGCFDGKYPCPPPKETSKNKFEQKITI